jgi:hypothetical protein
MQATPAFEAAALAVYVATALSALLRKPVMHRLLSPPQ